MTERHADKPRALLRRCFKMIVSGIACTFVLNGGAAHADSIDDAARRYQIDADLLRSIAYYESHLNPNAIHRNENGSIDIGLMQINSIHLPSLSESGISATMLKNERINAQVGASLLRDHIDRYGATWQAVGEYHSHNGALRAQYAKAIHDVYVRRPWLRRAGRDERTAAASVAVEKIGID